MNREEFVLAVLSTGDRNPFSPVQVQKIFFLLDKNITEDIGGPFFSFQPYNYGPFDIKVYKTLEELEERGLVSISHHKTWNQYHLTSAGQQFGEEHFQSLTPEAQEYIQKISKFVRQLSFHDLVSVIYKAYPEMKVNSVITE